MRALVIKLDPAAPWITENRPVDPVKLDTLRRDPDQQDLRSYWVRFADVVSEAFRRHGWEVEAPVLDRWDITPETVDSHGADIAFAPHSTRDQFGSGRTPVMFYMQVMQRWLFTADPEGWGPAASSYPCDFSAGDPARDTFDRYRDRLLAGNVSKFRQEASRDRRALVEAGEIPDAPYIFFPCQIPHDESLRFFARFPEVDLVGALADWANASGAHIVFKDHPANPRSMRPLRVAAPESECVSWSGASVHDLIRESRAVYTLNSGVGFEALFAERPVVTFADAEYDAVTVKADLDGLDAADRACRDWDAGREMDRRRRFIDWYCRLHALDLSAEAGDLNTRLDALVERAARHVRH